jgi:hypothetical protein
VSRSGKLLSRSPRLDETSGPFMDTAAVMKNLDLVIAADTSVAHLASALGVPGSGSPCSSRRTALAAGARG